jgi:hypothetical protein
VKALSCRVSTLLPTCVVVQEDHTARTHMVPTDEAILAQESAIKCVSLRTQGFVT